MRAPLRGSFKGYCVGSFKGSCKGYCKGSFKGSFKGYCKGSFKGLGLSNVQDQWSLRVHQPRFLLGCRRVHAILCQDRLLGSFGLGFRVQGSDLGTEELRVGSRFRVR